MESGLQARGHCADIDIDIYRVMEKYGTCTNNVFIKFQNLVTIHSSWISLVDITRQCSADRSAEVGNDIC